MLKKKVEKTQIVNVGNLIGVEPLDTISNTKTCIEYLNKIHPSIIEEFRQFYNWHTPFKVNTKIDIGCRSKGKAPSQYYCLYFGSHSFTAKIVGKQEAKNILDILNYFMIQLNFNCIEIGKKYFVYSVI